MADLLGIPRGRLPVAIAMVVVLGATLVWLQSKFDSTDVRKGITLALKHQPGPGCATVFEALAGRGEGDPSCDGQVMSTLLGDIAVRCSTPRAPQTVYEFRVLLDGKRPPRPANPAASALWELARVCKPPPAAVPSKP